MEGLGYGLVRVLRRSTAVAPITTPQTPKASQRRPTRCIHVKILVAGARNSRFLRLVEGVVPRVAA